MTRCAAYTLPELMVATAVGSMMLGGLMITSTSLQRWFASADFVIGCQQDQATVLDYMARDVRRASAVAVQNGDRKLVLTVPDAGSRAADGTLAAPALSGTAVHYGATAGTVSYYVQGNALVRETAVGTATLSTNIEEIHTDVTQPPVVLLQLLFKPAPRRTTGVTATARIYRRNLTGSLQ